MEGFIKMCQETIVDYLEDYELYCDRFDIRVIFSCQTESDKTAVMTSPFERDYNTYVCKFNGKTNEITIDLYEKYQTIEFN